MKELLIERFKEFPIKQGTVWQGIRLRPGWMNNDDNELFCPHMMLWGELPAHYILSQPKLFNTHPSHQDILNDLLQAIIQTDNKSAHRPSAIWVKDKNFADFLSAKLEPLDIRCEYKSSLPEIEIIAKDMMKSMGLKNADAHSLVNDDFFEITKITEEQMASFYDAGKILYRAEPWQYFTDSDLITIDYEDGNKFPKAFVVMGSGGMEFGLSFFDTSDQFYKMVMQASTTKNPPMPSSGMWAVNYSSIMELPTPELEAWEKHRWKVAGEDAFPVILNYRCKGRSYKVDRPNSQELAFFEAIMRFFRKNMTILRKKPTVKGKIPTLLGEKEISLHLH